MSGEGGITHGIARRSLLAAAPALIASACAPRRDPDALRFWAMSYEGDYAPWLMTSFTAATGVPVEVQSLPWTAAHEKLLTAFAGDALPDVMMLPNGWVGEFAMIGAVAPVTDAATMADLVPGAAATVAYGEIPYAIPWLAAPHMQFYRRDLLARVGYDAPPVDWAGWRAMGLRLKARSPDDYPLLMLLNWWDALFAFIAQTGARPLRDRDTRGAFRQPAIEAALAFYVSLFREGLAPIALSTEVQDPLAAFAQGYFAIYPNGPPLLLDLSRRANLIARDRWGVARMPGPRGPGPSSSLNAAIAVSRATRRPDAAWALARHVTTAASELRFQRLIGPFPARASAWRDPQLADPRLAAFGAQIHDPSPPIGIVEFERIRIDVQLVAERVVRGQLTIREGMAEMDRQVDRILTKRRALVDAGKIA
jgi:ABC-type glycerol-3-phosphate transport system substrate-binding protein